MKNLKEQKPDVENVQAVDVELNEEQLDVVSGGEMPDFTSTPNFTWVVAAIDQILKLEK